MLKYAISFIAIFAAPVAYADGYTARQGVVTNIQPIYRTVYEPVVQEQCFEARVPIYSHNRSSGGDAVTGAIVGGIIGSQFGSGSGKDAMTILGAIAGANSADRKSRVVGYTTEWRCEMVRYEKEHRELTYYQITYQIDGRYYQLNTDRQFEVGQRITIK